MTGVTGKYTAAKTAVTPVTPVTVFSEKGVQGEHPAPRRAPVVVIWSETECHNYYGVTYGNVSKKASAGKEKKYGSENSIVLSGEGQLVAQQQNVFG